MVRLVRRARRLLLLAVIAGPVTAGGTVAVTHHLATAGAAHVRCHYRHVGAQPLPDPTCTPGAVDHAVTQANLASTICKAGYTAKVRPPLSVTSVDKRANAIAYGYKGNPDYSEYDHLVPLELGGAPADLRNLWVEPPSPGHTPAQGVNNPKDAVENALNVMVCDVLHLRSQGRGAATSFLPLATAQHLIAINWTTAMAQARSHLTHTS